MKLVHMLLCDVYLQSVTLTCSPQMSLARLEISTTRLYYSSVQLTGSACMCVDTCKLQDSTVEI